MKKRKRKKTRRVRKVLLIVGLIIVLAIVSFLIGNWTYHKLTEKADKTADAVATTELEIAQEKTEPEKLLSATVVTQAVSIEGVKVYPSSSTDEREVYKVSMGKDGEFKVYAPEITDLVACEVSRADNQPLTPRPEFHWINADGDMIGINRQLLQDGGAVVLKKLEEGVSYKIVLRTEDQAYEIFIQPFS